MRLHTASRHKKQITKEEQINLTSWSLARSTIETQRKLQHPDAKLVHIALRTICEHASETKVNVDACIIIANFCADVIKNHNVSTEDELYDHTEVQFATGAIGRNCARLIIEATTEKEVEECTLIASAAFTILDGCGIQVPPFIYELMSTAKQTNMWQRKKT